MKETTIQTPAPETLARDFASVLKTWLTPEEQKKVIDLNKSYVGTEYENCCATGDFCDSNMAMEEALQKHGIECNPQDDAQAALWNEAWAIAKQNRFWFEAN